MTQTTLFRWSSRDLWSGGVSWLDIPESERKRPRVCPCCDTSLLRRVTSRDDWDRSDDSSRCPLCGWDYTYHSENQEFGVGDGLYVSTLLTLQSNHAQPALTALAMHLRKNFADIYRLDWRQLEHLVADVFRAHGHEVVLTSPTKDGGADVLLFHESEGQLYSIVEVKKRKGSRSVGVDLVRNLVGAAIDWGVQEAYLVTTSRISRPAKDLSLRYRARGLEVDLVAASELFQLLQIYDRSIPRLEFLSATARSALIEANRNTWSHEGWTG
jgi:HJR/Mrr/RecB family endonuclease